MGAHQPISEDSWLELCGHYNKEEEKDSSEQRRKKEAEMTEESKPNGQPLRLIEIESMADNGNPQHEEDTLLSVLHRLFSSVFFPDPSTSAPHSLIQRLRVALSENGPSLKEASRNSTTKLLRWTRRGSPFRALFVISVCKIPQSHFVFSFCYSVFSLFDLAWIRTFVVWFHCDFSFLYIDVGFFGCV